MVTEMEFILEQGEYTLYVELDSEAESVDFHLCTYSQHELSLVEV